MSSSTASNVREFERQLDDALEARPLMRVGGTRALRLAANVVDMAYAEYPETGSHFARGLQILAPALIGRGSGDDMDVADVASDLDFAAHYHVLRDFLYYTYNAPGSISWTFEKDRVEIRFADASLPRQFYIAANNNFLDSMAAFADQEPHRKIEELVRDSPEFEPTSESEEVFALILDEVEKKFRLYFNFVDNESVSAGAYTFSEFLEVYRALLVKSLYHRYHAKVNGARGVLAMPLAALASDLQESVENVSADTAKRIVLDISYGSAAVKARLNPVYFSLYHIPEDDEIVMLPHHFAYWEGYTNFLRLVALRNPQLFLRSFSGQIGSGLVRRLEKTFAEGGFHVRTNVPLTGYDTALPDIDLLIISEEKTLGYVVFVCEVKSPLPPRWAKDQLRVLEADSIAKAFSQLERVTTFLSSDDGVRFLTDQLPRYGLADFDEFALLLNTLVVTSDNAGAFFSDRGTVIDFRTLERIVSRCDGDTLFLLNALKQFPEWADRNLARVMVNTQVAERVVSYEATKIESLMDFPQNAFRSVDAPDQMVQDMLDAGHRPLDVLREPGIGD